MPYLTDRIEETKRRMDENDRLDAETSRQSDPSAEPTGLRYQSRYSFTPDSVCDELEQTIFGQKKAVDLIVDVMKVASVGLSDPRKPLASILFTGPTGVGKTECVRSVARAVHGTSEALCRIDMNTLSQEHYAAAFSGSPPGYVGSKEGMTLLDQEKIEGTSKLPGIVLFDELEKASNEVVLALMNVLDNGILTVASGERTISFRNTIIFMTSNLGASDQSSLLSRISRTFKRALLPKNADIEQGSNSDITNELLETYPPEFVNRLDHIQQLLLLDKSTMNLLVAHQIELLNHRLAAHQVYVTVDNDVSEFLAAKGFDPRFGARELRRVFRSAFEFPLARVMAKPNSTSEKNGPGLKIAAKLVGTSITFQCNT